MKRNFRHLMLLGLALAVGFSSCSKDDANEDQDKIVNTEETNIKISVSTGQSNLSRAAGTSTEAVTGGENTLASSVYVFVFRDEDGSLEYSKSLTLTSSSTPTFTITTGDKYFYIFSDPGNVTGLSSYIGSSINRSDFEKLVVTDVKANVETNEFVNVAEPNATPANAKFVNGTLWGTKFSVSSSTTNVPVVLGRMAGKVRLNPFSGTISTTMAGAFSAPQYRLGSVAIKTYMVGQFAGTIVPPTMGHGVVSSVVHNEAWGASTTQNPLFANYSTFVAPSTSTVFYVNENTSGKIGSITGSGPYYGNTTYIQFKVVYTPDFATEVYDAASASTIARSTNATYFADEDGFYTAMVNDPATGAAGKILIFDADPSSLSYIDASTVKYYKGGVNYYKFPVRDRSESGLEKQCRVLRNHFYAASVNSISRLGDSTDVVDPWEPIEEEVDLDISISVADWSYISQSEDL